MWVIRGFSKFNQGNQRIKLIYQKILNGYYFTSTMQGLAIQQGERYKDVHDYIATFNKEWKGGLSGVVS